MKSLVLVCVAALTAACGSQGLSSPTGPMPTGGGLAPGIVGLASHAGGHAGAIGPELPAQNCNQERSLRSVSSTTASRVEFVNQSTTTKVIYWLSYTGERVRFATLPPLWWLNQATYLTHPWVVTDEAGGCVGIYLSAANPATVTIRDVVQPLTAALIARSLAVEINSAFIAAMQSSVTAQRRNGVVGCSRGGTIRVQHLGPAPGGGRVSLSNAPVSVSGCTHALNGRNIVAHGVLMANGTWTAEAPTSPVHLAGDLGIDEMGVIGIDGVTGVGFDGRIGGVGVQPDGPKDTPPPPNPPALGIAKYDGAYDFTLTIPTGNGTQTTQTVRRFWHVSNGVVTSTDGTLRGTVDGSGGVRFTGQCPINSELADWTGNLDWTAQPGFNHGEGRYVCRMPISGNLTWRVQQTR